MVDPKLLAVLRCPIDGSRLDLADSALVQRINEAIGRGEIRDCADQTVGVEIDGGLVSQQRTRLYPVRGGIPSLIADEAIEIPR